MNDASKRCAVVIGGGPAGLMAAEMIAATGHAVDIYDAMPSAGRKFLLAGIGGMNITHSEDFESFVSRYRERAPEIRSLLEAFSPDALRAWIHGLGIETFIGTSGRVFPREMKAAPLLRAWLHRLRDAGARIHTRHRWQGWDENGALIFATREGIKTVTADTVVLALGGASWSRLGSDAAWLPWLRGKGVAINELKPANCGFGAAWSEYFRQRFAGEPVKPVIMSFDDAKRARHEKQGEFIVTEHGIEGSLVYALSAPVRDEILRAGQATVHLDLAPGKTETEILGELEKPRGSKSLSEHLRRRLGIKGVKAGLLREYLNASDMNNTAMLARSIKALPLRLHGNRPIDEAISTAGGVAFEALDENLMLKALPGVFCAGEMLDWEAPTGGYLLTACFASGRKAGEGAGVWLKAF